jgi:beta-glucosidase
LTAYDAHTIQQKVDELLAKMTLAEKIGQMFQTDPVIFLRSVDSGEQATTIITGPEQTHHLEPVVLYNLGSILGSADGQTAYRIQKQYMENNRLKIPLLFMFDIIHGFRTIFPIPLALACSWDLKLIEETARVAAAEGAASGIHVTFAPMVDLVRDPRWGRVMESSGEDPYLNSRIAEAYVRGFQGDLGEPGTVASCVKHFAAYGAAEGGRDYNTVDISESSLRESYLPAYRAGLDAGAELVMTSFNVVDGVPATINKFLLRDILRHEWGYDGIVISDYTSLAETIAHMAVKDGREAAQRALEAGLDIEMISMAYVRHLEDLVRSGEVDEALIDEAVRRILTLKFKLGLFDDPYRYINLEAEQAAHLRPEYRQLSREAAAKSIVLLKNDGVLPLSRSVRSVAVIGPLADSGQILGGWSAMGKHEEAVTLRQGIASKLGTDVTVTAVAGCDIDSTDESGFAEALAAAETADVVILALGEREDMSGEAGSRVFLNVPGVQQKLAEEVMKLGKPTVLVLFNGRPLDLRWFDEHVPAIVEAWYPGTEGGHAVADILFGDVNPSGKLTMSFPYAVGQIPVYYNCLNTGRPKGHEDNDFRFISKYLDAPNRPLYPFGYGLSYTTFTYEEAALDGSVLRPDGKLHARVTVTNSGQYAGEEVVQLYVRDLWGSRSRPLLELKGFRKVKLAPGESVQVEFEITPEMLQYYTARRIFETEPGDFLVFVGSSSRDIIECGKFTFKTL